MELYCNMIGKLIKKSFSSFVIDLKNLIAWYLMSSSDRRLISTNKKIKMTSSGACYVLGGGPSLSGVDFGNLEGAYMIGVNSLFKLQSLPVEKFSAWFFYDIFVHPFTSKSLEEMRLFESLIGSKTDIYLPIEGRKIIERFNLFDKNNIVYFITSVEPLSIDEYSRYCDMSKIIIFPHNIIELAVVGAMYMGFNNINLLGCDSDWFVYDGLNINHCYDSDCDSTRDSVLVPSGVNIFNMSSMEMKLYYSYLLYRNYRYLNFYASNNGVLIMDRTERGRLDMFAKKSLI